MASGTSRAEFFWSFITPTTLTEQEYFSFITQQLKHICEFAWWVLKLIYHQASQSNYILGGLITGGGGL